MLNKFYKLSFSFFVFMGLIMSVAHADNYFYKGKIKGVFVSKNTSNGSITVNTNTDNTCVNRITYTLSVIVSSDLSDDIELCGYDQDASDTITFFGQYDTNSESQLNLNRYGLNPISTNGSIIYASTTHIWPVPIINQPTAHKLSVYTKDSSGATSDNATYDITVVGVPVLNHINNDTISEGATTTAVSASPYNPINVSSDNSTSISATFKSINGSGSICNGSDTTGPSYKASCSGYVNALDNTTVSIVASNIGSVSTSTFTILARPIVLNANDMIGSTGTDVALSFTTDGSGCEVKYSDGNGSYLSFSPAINSVGSTTVDRPLKTFIATVPTKNLGDGIYGYRILCSDTSHTDRGSMSKTITLTLSSKPLATIYPNSSNPNFLDWKCINSKFAWIDGVSKTTMSGQIRNDDATHTVICGVTNNMNATDNATKIYNPSSLSLTQGGGSGSPYVDIAFTCPASSVSANLYKNGSKLAISGTSGSYRDSQVSNGNTYTYKLYCYDQDNSLIAYSEKVITIDGVSQGNNNNNNQAPVTSKVNCTYIYNGNQISCSSIPLCANGSYAIQINSKTDGTKENPNPSTAGGDSSFAYNSNTYQYQFYCPDNSAPTQILKAIVPPYAHFNSFNVSSMLVQPNTSINISWLVQNPTTTCSVKVLDKTGNDITSNTIFSTQNTIGSELNRNIKGVGVVSTTADGGFVTSGAVSMKIASTSRFVASCIEDNPSFSGTPLSGIHSIIRDVYVITEKEK